MAQAVGRWGRRVKPIRRHRVDQGDLQGNILAGYGQDYTHALYAFMRVEDDRLARQWLYELEPHVTTASPWGERGPPDYTVNVALSCNGLRALGVPEPMIDTFPREFKEGMAARAAILGDVGPSTPRNWDPRLGTKEHDVLVTLNALDPDALDEGRSAWLDPAVATGALTVAHAEEAALLGDPNTPGPGREHFGFADGFGQPTIKGNAGPYSRAGGGSATRWGHWKALAPGEFVLGYRAEDGTVAQRPEAPLRHSGTFTVVRKLYQNVAAFTKYLRHQGHGRAAREEWIAARIVGRWKDGTPVEASPDRPDAPLAASFGPDGQINDFRYRDDLDGMNCPLGAHVRRANPRDSFGWKTFWFRPDARLTKRHRIIRRGMPYGAVPEDPAVEDGLDRGLMFVCHQSSIERQFEVIQGQWLNDGDAFWLMSQRDLLTSGREPADPSRTGMTVQRRPPIFLPEPPPLVVTRGGGYFFTPGIEALHTIAVGGWI